MASLTRTTRSSMLEPWRRIYAHGPCRGVQRKDVVWSHALSNAMIPILTAFGLQFGAGDERSHSHRDGIFLAGVGRLIVDCVNRRDYSHGHGDGKHDDDVHQRRQLIVDIVYAYVDPRIKANITK